MLCALSIPDASCLYTFVQVAAPGKLKIASAGGLQQRSSSATLDDERVDAELSLPSSVMPAKNLPSA
jgi:hypothetical protein